MPMRSTDKIFAPARGTPQEAANSYSGPLKQFVQSYANTLYSAGEAVGIDPSILFAQADEETNHFTSGYAKKGNVAGIGIWKDGVASPFDLSHLPQASMGYFAALVQLASMWTRTRPHGDLPAILQPAQTIAGIDAYLANVGSLFREFPTAVITIDDLNDKFGPNTRECTWACDPQYHILVPEHGNAIFSNLPDQEVSMSVTFGNVPHPTFANHPITKPEGQGQDNLGQRSVKGIVWHRMLGHLDSTETYFKRPDVSALTDYGVGVSGSDPASEDGQIIRWNDPLGHQSGWASGTWSAPHAYGDGRAFVAKYGHGDIGVNVINRDQASIEISGMEDTPLTEKSRQAVAALTAYWADQYHIPWAQFPVSPVDGFSFVRWHEEFGPDEGQKHCPFDVVKAATPDLIERTRAILKQYQESAPTPPVVTYTRAKPIPKNTGLDSGSFKAIERLVTVGPDGAKRLSNGKVDAPLSGAPLKADSHVRVYFKQGPFWVASNRDRIHEDEIVEKVHFG